MARRPRRIQSTYARQQRQRRSSTCPPGQHWMPPANGQPGYCMQGSYHGAPSGNSGRILSFEEVKNQMNHTYGSNASLSVTQNDYIRAVQLVEKLDINAIGPRVARMASSGASAEQAATYFKGLIGHLGNDDGSGQQIGAHWSIYVLLAVLLIWATACGTRAMGLWEYDNHADEWWADPSCGGLLAQ